MSKEVNAEDKSNRIQSIEQGYFILKKISEANQPLAMKEIAEICGMSKSKLHRYLTSFRTIGLLEKSADSKYSLGSELILLGFRASEQLDITAKAENSLNELHQRLNELTILAVWGDKGPFFIKKVENQQKTLNIGVRVGYKLDMTQGATGKIFAAYMPEQKTKALLEEELKRYQLDKADFSKEVSQIKKQGHAITREKLLPGFVGIAAPVFKKKGELAAAITVVGLVDVLDGSDTSPVVPLIKSAALELSKKLGYEREYTV